MRMLAILSIAEFIGCSFVMSAIAWLRYLYGAPMSRDWHATMVRYLLPFLSVITVALQISLSIHEQQMGIYHADSPVLVNFALGCGVVLAALVAWLVVEVRRYRARSHRI